MRTVKFIYGETRRALVGRVQKLVSEAKVAEKDWYITAQLVAACRAPRRY